MAGMLQIICFVMLGALMCYAAVSDAQRRIIPNWMTLTIAALAVTYWLGTGLELWPDIALQLCQIGRATCRGRVCRYVWISVVAVSLKTKNKNIIRHHVTVKNP